MQNNKPSSKINAIVMILIIVPGDINNIFSRFISFIKDIRLRFLQRDKITSVFSCLINHYILYKVSLIPIQV